MPTRPARIAAKLAKFYGLEQRAFDFFLRTSTGGSVRQLDLTGESFPYEGCQWPAVSHAFKELSPDNSEVFLDFGSGKGKALLIAGQLPYEKVLGVELREELAESARNNIARAHRRLRAGHVECEVGNVLTWPIPDNSSTIFMYNPFFGQTFRSAISRVFESYDRNPRKLHIIYQYPLEHNWLISTGRVAVENVRSMRWPARRRWWVDEDEKVIVTYHVGTREQAAADRCLRHSRPDSEAVRRWGTTVPTLGQAVPVA